MGHAHRPCRRIGASPPERHFRTRPEHDARPTACVADDCHRARRTGLSAGACGRRQWPCTGQLGHLGASFSHRPPPLCSEHAVAHRVGRRRRDAGRNANGVADRAAAVSWKPLLRLGVAASAGDAGLCDGLCLHRFPAVRGTLADRAAGGVRVVAGRLFLPRRALATGGGAHVYLHALSLRLSPCAHRIPRASTRARALRCRTRTRPSRRGSTRSCRSL